MADYVTTSISDPGQSLVQITNALAVGGNITAYYSSDIKLKDNIRPIESALFKVQQINGVTFDWNEKSSKIQQGKGHDVGLIAQEVEKVLPEVVTTRDSGYMAVKYEKMIPLLIEGIKEQQKQIDELKEQIEEINNGT